MARQRRRKMALIWGNFRGLGLVSCGDKGQAARATLPDERWLATRRAKGRKRHPNVFNDAEDISPFFCLGFFPLSGYRCIGTKRSGEKSLVWGLESKVATTEAARCVC